MKLDFDPRKNITKLDYFIMQLDRVNRKIKDLLAVRSIVKNWYDILLFRAGLKKPEFVMQMRNGKKIEIKEPEDYFSFWESDEGQEGFSINHRFCYYKTSYESILFIRTYFYQYVGKRL